MLEDERGQVIRFSGSVGGLKRMLILEGEIGLVEAWISYYIDLALE